MDQPQNTETPQTWGLDEHVRDLQRRLTHYSRGHMLQAIKLKLYDDLATSVTVIGGVATLALSAALISASTLSTRLAPYLVGVSGVITVVGLVQSIWKPAHRSQQHKAASSKYSALENECKLINCGAGYKTYPELLDAFEAVNEQADLVPLSVWRAAQQSFLQDTH